MSKREQLGRIAFRVEGDMWNAYFAQKETMVGALWLGSLRMSAARDPKMKADFMSLMRAAITLAVEDVVGETPTWSAPKPAPESERGGGS